MAKATAPSLAAGARILLVDDNPHGLVARKAVLMGLGYQVETALNGEEALKLLNAGSFQLVVTDYKMPKLDGLQLIEHIRKAGMPLKVVLLSGFVEPLGLTEETTNADAVLPKSASEVTTLVRVIHRLLTLRKPMDSPRPAVRKRAGSV